MKTLITLLLTAFIFLNSGNGQIWPKLSWYKTYNGPGDGVDIVQDIKFHNGSFYLTGRSSGPDSSQDLLILKYSEKGDSLLGIRFSADIHSWDEAASLVLDSDENIYVIGSSSFDQNSFYALFQKYSHEGNLIFEKKFNGNIDITSEGGFVTLDSYEEPIIGYTQWNKGQSAKVSKYSASGDSVWTTTISDDTSNYSVNYLLTDLANNVYALLTQTYWDGSDVPASQAVVVKINNTGEIVWRFHIKGESPRKIISDKGQNIVLITQGDGRTIKIDPNGNLLWVNDYLTSQYPITIITGLVVDSHNNVIVSGYKFGNSSWDYRTKKISPDGADIWSNDFESPEGLNDFALDLAIDEEDNLYVTGSTQNQTSIGISYTVTYQSDGELGWIYRFDPPNSTFENSSRLFLGDSNFVYIGGTSGEPGLGPDFLAFKIAYGLGLDVSRLNNQIPSKYSLSQNYPNPFNPSTKIEFTIPKGEQVRLEVYDAFGRLTNQLIDNYLPAGNYRINFNASGLSSGIYFYRLSAGRFLQIKKALLLK